jgi:hypothetical protein
MRKDNAKPKPDGLCWPYFLSRNPVCINVISRRNPAGSARLDLMSSPPRGKVHVTTDKAH